MIETSTTDSSIVISLRSARTLRVIYCQARGSGCYSDYRPEESSSLSWSYTCLFRAVRSESLQALTIGDFHLWRFRPPMRPGPQFSPTDELLWYLSWTQCCSGVASHLILKPKPNLKRVEDLLSSPSSICLCPWTLSPFSIRLPGAELFF